MKLSMAVLVVVFMLVHFGESCGPVGPPIPTIHPRRLHFPNTTRRMFDLDRIKQCQNVIQHGCYTLYNNVRTCSPGFTENDSVLSRIAKDGADRGLEECQKLFENRTRPWNCPEEMYKKLPMYSDKTFPYATRETGFIHAISAAAITHELTRQCTQGKIPGCGCPKSLPPEDRQGRMGRWDMWECGDNIGFGQNESKRFTDDLEKGNDAVRAVNLHNNQVGREVVRTIARVACKCFRFFYSTGCGYIACWIQLPPFEVILEKLKEKYYHSEQVWLVDNKLRARNNSQLTSVRKTSSKDPTLNLAYLDSSPDLCAGNATLGHPGMLGHSCRADVSEDKCELFPANCKSCKLRVQIVEHTKQVECGCKFVWCCSRVECEVCTEKYSVMTCSL